MPELPEVEMVTRHLHELITRRTIIKAQLKRPGLAPAHSPQQFAALLRNGTVSEVGRRGKHILIHFDCARTLIVHLRMTGRFFYLSAAAPDAPHTHAVFHLDNGRRLSFADQRHFGMMLIVQAEEVNTCRPLRDLAPEPFSADFSPAYLYRTLQASRQAIKLAVLDQTKVLGLGNIYASEALHRAGINPQLPAAQLSRPRAARLHGEIIKVLAEAIEAGSTLNTDPQQLDASYAGGQYETLARVYERAGLPCPKCQSLIRRFTQGARSTYYCPRCQRQ